MCPVCTRMQPRAQALGKKQTNKPHRGERQIETPNSCRRIRLPRWRTGSDCWGYRCLKVRSRIKRAVTSIACHIPTHAISDSQIHTPLARRNCSLKIPTRPRNGSLAGHKVNTLAHNSRCTVRDKGSVRWDRDGWLQLWHTAPPRKRPAGRKPLTAGEKYSTLWNRREECSRVARLPLQRFRINLLR